MRTRTLLFLGLIGAFASGGALSFPWYASGEGIWGAGLMSPEERSEYVLRIRGMKSREECSTYVEAHREEIRSRARARNVALPPPPVSACEMMERMGRFSGNAPDCPTGK